MKSELFKNRLIILPLFSCSVYAPMSVRLIQYCSKPGWKSIIDSLDLLPGPSFEEYQNSSQNKNKLETTKKIRQNNGTKRTLVVFVGGCTYAEISALRFLSQQEDSATGKTNVSKNIINSCQIPELGPITIFMIPDQITITWKNVIPNQIMIT